MSGEPIPELVGEFEASLAEKIRSIGAPGAARTALEAWSERDLEQVRREAAGIARTLCRFAAAVAEAMESPRCAHDFLRQLDLKTVSRDHNWRRIFAELADQSPCFDGHKRALIVRYLQFLSERKRLVDAVLASRLGLEETAERSSARTGASSDGREVPPGETAVVAVAPTRPARIWLGRHCLSLHAGRERPRLEGTEGGTGQGPGRARELKLGRNILGRHPECDVVLDPSWRDASRVHALLEWHREWGAGASAVAAGTDDREFVLHLTALAPQTRLAADG